MWPNVVEAMREVGIDLTGRRPKKLTVEMQLHADWAVTLACGGTCPYVPSVVEAWDVPDPAGQPLEVVRAIRDAVEARVLELATERIDLVRADRTAHERRLEALLPGLIERFAGERSDAEIRTVADAVLLEFQDAPIRSFVLPLAQRRGTELLAGSAQPA